MRGRDADGGGGDAGLPRRIAAFAGSLGPAMGGQAASFGALLAPILGHRIEAVALLVTVSAIGNTATAVGSWSFASVYPSVGTGVAARPAVPVAVLGAALMSVLLLVGAVSAVEAFPAAAAVLAVSALFTVCQTAYYIALGFWIRQNAVRRIGHVRLAYGVTNLMLAVIASLPAVPDVGLSIATSLAFLVAAVLTLLAAPRTGRVLLATVFHVAPRSMTRHAATHWRAALAGFLTNVGLQASAVIVLSLAEFRAAWAIVLRIGGGFGTIGVSILGPRVQAEVARAMRRGDARAALAATRAGLGAGVALAVVSLLTIATVLIYAGVLAPLDLTQTTILAAATIFFIVTTTSPSPLTANLVLLGRQRVNLVLNVVRVVALVPALLLREPVAVLLVLVGVEGLVQIVYAVLCLRVAARLGIPDARGVDQSRTAIGSSGVR